jgi:hypothetical protein
MLGSEHLQDLLILMNVGSHRTHLFNITKIILKGGMVQVVVYLPRKHKALSSISRSVKIIYKILMNYTKPNLRTCLPK